MYEHIFAETPQERAQRYRHLALAAGESAAREQLPEIRAAYLRSAERWNKLASIMELGIGHEPRRTSKADYAKSAKKAKGWTIHKQQSGPPHHAPRYDSVPGMRAESGKQSDTGVAAAGGLGIRRPVLGRRSGLGRTTAFPVTRTRRV